MFYFSPPTQIWRAITSRRGYANDLPHQVRNTDRRVLGKLGGWMAIVRDSFA